MATDAMTDYFKSFWEGKRDSGSRTNADLDLIQLAGAEIRAFRSLWENRNALEVGCGAGELSARAGFERDFYLGADFSSSILETFSRRHPGVRLIQGEASRFYIEEKFDFILLNNVVQYLSTPRLHDCLKNLRRMLAPDEAILLANVPNRSLRLKFELGSFQVPRLSNGQRLKNFCKTQANRLRLKTMPIGFWHSSNKLIKTADHLELKGWCFGSLLYPYRFTLLLRHKQKPNPLSLETAT